MVRRKQRYILFRIEVEDSGGDDLDLNPGTIPKFLKPAFQELFGDFGVGSVFPTLKVITWIPEKNAGVFKIVREWCDNFVLMLEQIETFNHKNVKISVPHVSGTVDQAQKWISDNPSFLD